MKLLIKSCAFIFILFLASHLNAIQKEDSTNYSLQKQIIELQSSNEYLKENILNFKQNAVDKTVTQYQQTNDRINNYISFLTILASIFGIAITIAGLWIAL